MRIERDKRKIGVDAEIPKFWKVKHWRLKISKKLEAYLLTDHFSFDPSKFLYCKFVCRCEDPAFSAFIACMSHLWQSGSHFHISLVGIEIVALLGNLFSPHLCYYINPIASTDYNATVPCSQDLFLKRRSDFASVSRAGSETNQSRPRNLGLHHHPNLLFPQ